MNNKNNSDNRRQICAHDNKQDGDRYCTVCGHPLSTVTWQLQIGTAPPIDLDADQPECSDVSVGDVLTLRAVNRGPLTPPLRVEAQNLNRVTLVQVAPAEWQLTIGAGAGDIDGELRLFSEDGPRPEEKWWENASWRPGTISLKSHFRAVEATWRLGIGIDGNRGNLDFYDRVDVRQIMVWNDAPTERTLTWQLPEGFGARCIPVPVPPMGEIGMERRPTDFVRAGGSPAPPEKPVMLEVMDKRRTRDRGVDPKESARIADAEITILYRKSARPQSLERYDAVIAIDFGTRNTGLRFAWLEAASGGKRPPKKPIEVCPPGCDCSFGRFPSQMIFHKSGSLELIGTEAQQRIERGGVDNDLVVIDDLKTILRTGDRVLDQFDPPRRASELLALYFSRLLAMVRTEMQKSLDDYLPVNRLHIKHVVCHPVLGDAEKQQGYIDLLRQALHQAAVTEEARFLPEPTAAALWLIQECPEIFQGQEGNRIAIVDSGGGTTDVTCGVLKRQGETGYALEGMTSSVVHLGQGGVLREARQLYAPPHGASPNASDHEFGGNVLDMVLAYYMTGSRWQKILTKLDDNVPETTVIFDEESAGSDVKRATNLARARLLKEAVIKDQLKVLRKEGEVNLFPDGPLDLAKLQLSINQYRSNVVDEVLASARVGEVQAVPTVICVGGTSRDTRVEAKLTDRLGGSRLNVTISDELRFTAVVNGAALAVDYLDAYAPATISIGFDGAQESGHEEQEEKELLRRAAALPHPRLPLTDQIRITIPEQALWSPALIARFDGVGAAAAGTGAPATPLASPVAQPASAFPPSLPGGWGALTPPPPATPAPAPVALPGTAQPSASRSVLARAHIDGRVYGGAPATIFWRISIVHGVQAWLSLPETREWLWLWSVPLVGRSEREDARQTTPGKA